MKIPEVISELQQVEELIQELNAKTPHMALKKLRNERQQCKERTEQLQAVLEALGCSNNWRNAVARAQTLMKGQQETPLPMWLQTVSPAGSTGYHSARISTGLLLKIWMAPWPMDHMTRKIMTQGKNLSARHTLNGCQKNLSI